MFNASLVPVLLCDQGAIVLSRLQHWYIVAMTAALVQVGRPEDSRCIDSGKCIVLCSRARLNLWSWTSEIVNVKPTASLTIHVCVRVCMHAWREDGVPVTDSESVYQGSASMNLWRFCKWKTFLTFQPLLELRSCDFGYCSKGRQEGWWRWY